jgi:mannosyl-oligosaccharide alpha-1,2-mannosidase
VQHRPANEILFKWKTRKEDYPVPTESAIALPTGTALPIPRIQHNFTNTPKDEEYLTRLSDRRNDIKKALKRGWEGYKTFAYGKDELAVESASSREHFGGWGATLVDTLDTLWITGMEEEFKDALMVLKDIDFSWTGLKTINVFETNIRYLGGLLAAHDLTGGKYTVLLEKAIEVGDLLYASFDTPNRMPLTRWAWKK